MQALPAPVQASPAPPRPSDGDNPYSGGKDKVARERVRGRPGQAGAAGAAGPMRKRLEGGDRDSGNNPFVMAADNVSFANGFSHNQKLSKLPPARPPPVPRPHPRSSPPPESLLVCNGGNGGLCVRARHGSRHACRVCLVARVCV